ncbi:MAG: hypothetical protein ACREXX_17700, partial [Gammaproteobacteria bacterium]
TAVPQEFVKTGQEKWFGCAAWTCQKAGDEKKQVDTTEPPRHYSAATNLPAYTDASCGKTRP